MDHVHHNIRSGRDLQKEKTVKKGIAFFDFDGTITTKDTLLEFIRFCKGSFHFYLGFLLNIHYLIAFKVRLISNQTAKEKVLRYFFKGTTVEEFRSCCRSFNDSVLPGLIRKKAIEEIKKHQQKNIVVVVVSASPGNWIEKWAYDMDVQLLSSRLEVIDDKVTGRILGKNCHGPEKVRRIREAFELEQYDPVFAYGDSKGDRPMMQLASECFYKPFR